MLVHLIQTMAATKRNAGLTSAIPRPTLNDEDLVSSPLNSIWLLVLSCQFIRFRKLMCTKNRCKHLSIRFRQQRHIISRPIMLRRQHIAMSAKVNRNSSLINKIIKCSTLFPQVYYGESLVRVLGVLSAASNVTKSAKTS